MIKMKNEEYKNKNNNNDINKLSNSIKMIH